MEEEIQNTQSSAQKFIVPTIVAALIVFAVIGYYLYSSNNSTGQKQEAMKPQGSATQVEPPVAASPEKVSAYKNGTYKVTGNYVSPGGPREVGVTLTLADGVITEAAAEVLATDATSKRFQGEFVDNFKPMVVGKNIDEVILSKVSGSSLTPKGFNDAVAKIKVEAGV